jgi:hypothetical protein
VVAPDDRPPTGSEPVAVEPAADREARTVTNEASGPTGEAPIATNEAINQSGEAPIATNEAINQSGEARRAGANLVSRPLPLPDGPVVADRGSAGEIADGPPLTPASCETPLGGLP